MSTQTRQSQVTPFFSLYLGRTTLSDEVVLDIIKVLPQLKALIVRQALVGNRLLEGIPSMQQLDYLELTETNVTVDGLQHLLELPNLRELYLKNLVITDQELKTFPLLYGLQLLSLEGTNVSKGSHREAPRTPPWLHDHLLIYPTASIVPLAIASGLCAVTQTTPPPPHRRRPA